MKNKDFHIYSLYSKPFNEANKLDNPLTEYSYLKLEQQLKSEIKEILYTESSINGYPYCKDQGFNVGDEFAVEPNIFKRGRELNILLKGKSEYKTKTIDLSTSLNTFGRINKINLCISKRLHFYGKETLNMIKCLIESWHRALEYAVVQSCQITRFSSLYSKVDNFLEREGYGNLVKNYTLIKYTENKGSYLFDKTRLVSAIEHFKTYQNSCFNPKNSPFDYLMGLINYHLPYHNTYAAELIKTGKECGTLPWRLAKFKDSKIYDSARARHSDFSDYFVYPITSLKSNTITLSNVCKPEYKDILIMAFSELNYELERDFKYILERSEPSIMSSIGKIDLNWQKVIAILKELLKISKIFRG
ncbi:MAG: hypothetical protein ACPGJS_17575 [Flammeovirgaceae bacterium]